jgi:ABC-type oligopeptide transport system substrate-binding subunit
VKLEKVIFLPLEDTSTGLSLYKAGEIDTMQSGSIPLAFVKALKKKRDYVKGTFFTTYYYSINIKRKPFDDIRVRRALNMAVDKDAIANQLVGRGEVPATSFVPPGIAGYPEVKGPGYDPEQARELLAEAGYPNGKGFPKITIYFNTLEAHRQIAEAVQRMWKENLKINNVELQNEEWQTFTARRERRDFDLSRDGWTGDYIDANTFLDLFANDSLNNHSGWVNDDYTRLLNQANAEPDHTKRNELLAKAEQLMLDESPIIPVYFYALNYLKKPYIDGWYRNLLDYHPLKFVSVRENWTVDSPIIADDESDTDSDRAQEPKKKQGEGSQSGY